MCGSNSEISPGTGGNGISVCQLIHFLKEFSLPVFVYFMVARIYLTTNLYHLDVHNKYLDSFRYNHPTEQQQQSATECPKPLTLIRTLGLTLPALLRLMVVRIGYDTVCNAWNGCIA